jgi:hypothetical protein
VYAIPVQLAQSPPLTLIINPLLLATSGTIVTAKDVHIVVNAKAETSLATAPPPAISKGPLPPATTISDQPGHIAIALAVRAGYDAVRAAALNAIKSPVTFQVGNKQGTLTVTDIVSYPSGPALAVGVSFTATLPARLFDTSGRVFLTAVPTVSSDGQRLTLTNVSFARQVDNSLWSVLSAVFEGQIRKQIESRAVVDLKPQIDQSLVALKSAIADPEKTGGIRLSVENPKLRLESLVPEAKALAVLAVAEADVEGELISIGTH